MCGPVTPACVIAARIVIRCGVSAPCRTAVKTAATTTVRCARNSGCRSAVRVGVTVGVRALTNVVTNEDWVDPEPRNGPYDQDRDGKIKGEPADLPEAEDIDEGELLGAEQQLLESIDARENEQRRYDSGDPGGDNQDRQNSREYRKHDRRLNYER